MQNSVKKISSGFGWIGVIFLGLLFIASVGTVTFPPGTRAAPPGRCDPWPQCKDDGGGDPGGEEPTYAIIDLGTLGGAQSRANDINDVGQITGGAETGPGLELAVIWSVNSVGQVESVEALPTLVSGLRCYGKAINNSGTIVGYCNTGNQEDSSHAVLWKNGELTDLALQYGLPLTVDDINDNGQILAGEQYPSTGGPYLLDNGMVTELGAPFAYAFGVNDAGEAVGQSAERALMAKNGNVIDLGSLSGIYSFAEAINDSGQIVGGDGEVGISLHPTLWTLDASGWLVDSITDLGTLGGNNGWATDINNSGQVVGFTRTGKKKDSDHHFAFIWSDDQMVGLGTLERPYNHFSWAEAINESGFVVGSSYDNKHRSRATLWVPQ